MTTDIEFRLKNIESNIEKVLSLLNGRNGVITTLELHQQKMEDIPGPATIKWYATIGGSLISGIGIITYVIYQSIRSAITGGGG